MPTTCGVDCRHFCSTDLGDWRVLVKCCYHKTCLVGNYRNHELMWQNSPSHSYLGPLIVMFTPETFFGVPFSYTLDYLHFLFQNVCLIYLPLRRSICRFLHFWCIKLGRNHLVVVRFWRITNKNITVSHGKAQFEK